MGQTQSSADSGRSEEESDNALVKQDYYDLLGVDRTATEDEIKKAYRRKALELHPDRNYGNEEGATRLFAEIQSAHEVLSDPQERAWYDSHRDVLLRGEEVGASGEEYSYNMRMTGADEVLKLMMQFNRRTEYSDAPSGFYGGLNDFFKKIAKEEDVACQWQDVGFLDYPDFGSRDDDYEDIVRPFYAVWTGFATKKSYSWKDKYRLSDAPDRRIRRLMEKENQKMRDDGIQEFNDAVRSLVAFVKKRDVRVQDNQKSDAERQKILRDAAAAQAARARAQRQKQMEEYDHAAVPEWAQSRFKDELEGGFSSESEQEEHEYDCVVCDKTFKSEAQFHAHEKSKKHVKLLKELRKDLRKQGKDLDLRPQDSPAAADDLETPNTPEKQSDEREKEAESDYNNMPHTRNSNHSNPEGPSSDEEALGSGNSPTEMSNTHGTSETSGPSDNDLGNEYAPRSKVEERLVSQLDQLQLDDSANASADSESLGQSKVGKAKQKRAKKAAQQAVTSEITASGAEFRCTVCKGEFTSKTKLFSHIREKGHAAPLAQVQPRGSGTKGKGRKK